MKKNLFYLALLPLIFIFSANINTFAVSLEPSNLSYLSETKLTETQRANLSKQIVEYLNQNPTLLDDLIDQSIARFITRQQELEADSQKQRELIREQSAQSLPDTIKPTDHIKGSLDAQFLLVDYSDFQCPFCRRFHITADQFYQKYKNEVALIYRHFPLPSHEPLASKQAIAAECIGKIAGSDAFWQTSDLIFETNPRDENAMIQIAEKLAISKKEFMNCFSDEEQIAAISQRINQDLTEGQRVGVMGTPGVFLINQKTKEVKIIPGAVGLDYLENALSQLR